ncbi:MAG: nuclear transport factor 2 family protein [Aquihabitans sp.]
MDHDRLETIRRLEALKYRYVRALDTKDWDALAATFESDATADYGERLDFSGVGEIMAFMRENLGPTMITLHQVHQPELEVDGHEATGIWSLQDRVIMTEHRMILDGYATYHDRYRRGPDGNWRIAHTGYDRIYESMMSMDDVPSFKLTANRFA